MSAADPGNSMLPRMWSQLPCMNIAVNQLIPGCEGVAGGDDRARVERRVGDCRIEMRELIEDLHGEVRRDECDVDDGEAAGRHAV